MNLRSGGRPRRRLLGALAAICVLGGGIAYATFTEPVAAVTTGSLARFRAAIITHLTARHLDYHWVVCVRSGRRFAGVPIVRCNVDFGEPHIQAYCSVFRGGRLETSEDDPAIPCGHDDSGYSAQIVTFR